METETHNLVLQGFRLFMIKREEAEMALVNGDPRPLMEMCSAELRSTLFPHHGGALTGAMRIKERYRADASVFADGGESRFRTLHMDVSGHLGFWAGYAHELVRSVDDDHLTTVRLRITEIFHRENDGHWKMVHRHADPLMEEKGRRAHAPIHFFS